MDNNHVIHQGYLFKRGILGSPPERRYFFLNGTYLSYYNRFNYLTQIDLRGATVRPEVIHQCNVIDIRGPYTKGLTLQAQSKDEFIVWLNMLQTASVGEMTPRLLDQEDDWVLVDSNEKSSSFPMSPSFEQESNTQSPTFRSIPSLEKSSSLDKSGEFYESTVPDTTQTHTKIIKGQIVGKGGYGTVYCGLDAVTGTYVAVKEINVKLNEDDVERAKNEYMLLLNLPPHPNVVKVNSFHVDVNRHKAILVMEWVSGLSLRDNLHKFGPLPEPVVVRYLNQILQGLRFLHSNNILHNDIKPGNILIAENGLLKICDYGSAKNTKTHDSSGTYCTLTPMYAAPEVLRQGSVSVYSDIWSVACTAIEMYSGSQPYSGQNASDLSLIYMIGNHKLQPSLPEGSEPFIDLLQSCFAVSPTDRPTCDKLLQHPFLTANLERSGSNTNDDNTHIELISFRKNKSIYGPTMDSVSSSVTPPNASQLQTSISNSL